MRCSFEQHLTAAWSSVVADDLSAAEGRLGRRRAGLRAALAFHIDHRLGAAVVISDGLHGRKPRRSCIIALRAGV